MITIGRILFNTLKDVTGLAGKNIFPIVAPENTSLPFIIYERKGGDTFYTKDGLAYDAPVVTLWILSSTYEDSVNKAEIIRNLFERTTIVYNGKTISGGELEGIDEDFNGEAFIQKLVFKFKLHKN